MYPSPAPLKVLLLSKAVNRFGSKGVKLKQEGRIFPGQSSKDTIILEYDFLKTKWTNQHCAEKNTKVSSVKIYDRKVTSYLNKYRVERKLLFEYFKLSQCQHSEDIFTKQRVEIREYLGNGEQRYAAQVNLFQSSTETLSFELHHNYWKGEYECNSS